MHKLVADICAELGVISDQLEALNKTEGQGANEIWGSWQIPPIAPYALAMLPIDIKLALEAAGLDELTEEQAWNASETLAVLGRMRSGLIPNVYSSHPHGIVAYLSTMSYVSATLAPMMGWVTPNTNALPGALVRKLNKTERDLANLMPDMQEMEGRIQIIREAHDAAAALPTTMQELKDTQRSISRISESASELIGKIKTNKEQADGSLREIHTKATEAENLAKLAAEAHRITTTIGLASAFDGQATKLRRSMGFWVLGLAVALGGLMAVGHVRLTALKETLAATPFEPSRVWIQILISVLSVGAPLWFAWLATKQISQRFRLAEDYAFKAAVSKAYEGYRREAKNIDPAFERALFASALKRLDEAPLRLVEMSTHGSPVHEFAESSFIKNLVAAATGIANKVSPGNGKAEKTPSTSEAG